MLLNVDARKMEYIQMSIAQQRHLLFHTPFLQIQQKILQIQHTWHINMKLF